MGRGRAEAGAVSPDAQPQGGAVERDMHSSQQLVPSSTFRVPHFLLAFEKFSRGNCAQAAEASSNQATPLGDGAKIGPFRLKTERP